ncbi:YheC/YheD family protein [Priestia megaterium]
MFNPDFFNKWEIHELLKLNEQTAYLLPYTVESPSCEQIKTSASSSNRLFKTEKRKLRPGHLYPIF